MVCLIHNEDGSEDENNWIDLIISSRRSWEETREEDKEQKKRQSAIRVDYVEKSYKTNRRKKESRF